MNTRRRFYEKIAYILDCDTYKTGEWIYTDIPGLYGGWMATTDGGGPITLNDLEDCISDGIVGAEENLAYYESLMQDEGEPLEPEDVEYINEWLEIWGIPQI